MHHWVTFCRQCRRTHLTRSIYATRRYGLRKYSQAHPSGSGKSCSSPPRNNSNDNQTPASREHGTPNPSPIDATATAGPSHIDSLTQDDLFKANFKQSASSSFFTSSRIRNPSSTKRFANPPFPGSQEYIQEPSPWRDRMNHPKPSPRVIEEKPSTDPSLPPQPSLPQHDAHSKSSPKHAAPLRWSLESPHLSAHHNRHPDDHASSLLHLLQSYKKPGTKQLLPPFPSPTSDHDQSPISGSSLSAPSFPIKESTRPRAPTPLTTTAAPPTAPMSTHHHPSFPEPISPSHRQTPPFDFSSDDHRLSSIIEEVTLRLMPPYPSHNNLDRIYQKRDWIIMKRLIASLRPSHHSSEPSLSSKSQHPSQFTGKKKKKRWRSSRAKIPTLARIATNSEGAKHTSTSSSNRDAGALPSSDPHLSWVPRFTPMHVRDVWGRQAAK